MSRWLHPVLTLHAGPATSTRDRGRDPTRAVDIRVAIVLEGNMRAYTQQFRHSAIQLAFAAIAIGLVAVFSHPVSASESTGRGSNPCDTRDTCSADPGRYAEYRDTGPVKAREYVGEMRWGTGGAPDDVYVVTRTVGSRNFASANPCQVRDACITGHEAPKVVRGGPGGAEPPTAKQINSVQVANQPEKK
jgi:hypothetical protein